MLENHFTFYDEINGPFERVDMFHYRKCLYCGEIFKYPNIVSGDDPAPIHCHGFNSVAVEIVEKNGQ